MSLKESIGKMFNMRSDAPDLLLKKVCELENTLNTARQNPVKNAKAIDFYQNILNTMKYAWAFMEDMRPLQSRNQFLEQENRFLLEYAQTLQRKLNRYEVIEDLKATDDFKTVIDQVDAYLLGKPTEIKP